METLDTTVTLGSFVDVHLNELVRLEHFPYSGFGDYSKFGTRVTLPIVKRFLWFKWETEKTYKRGVFEVIKNDTVRIPEFYWDSWFPTIKEIVEKAEERLGYKVQVLKVKRLWELTSDLDVIE